MTFWHTFSYTDRHRPLIVHGYQLKIPVQAGMTESQYALAFLLGRGG